MLHINSWPHTCCLQTHGSKQVNISHDYQDIMRFLCLHGGGSSAQIFDAQLSTFQNALGPQYEFVFMKGEIASEAGSGELYISLPMGFSLLLHF